MSRHWPGCWPHPHIVTPRVSITPQQAVAIHAQWRVDGGIAQPSGANRLGLTLGSHTVSFSTIGGFLAPSNQTVVISANSTTVDTGIYVALTQGDVEVSILPAAAVSAGAEWQVDDGNPEYSGTIVSNLLIGTHTISFISLPGWIAPSNIAVVITSNAIVNLTGVYSKRLKGILNSPSLRPSPAKL